MTQAQIDTWYDDGWGNLPDYADWGDIPDFVAWGDIPDLIGLGVDDTWDAAGFGDPFDYDPIGYEYDRFGKKDVYGLDPVEDIGELDDASGSIDFWQGAAVSIPRLNFRRWWQTPDGEVDVNKLPDGVEYLPSIGMFQYLTWDAKGVPNVQLTRTPPTARQLRKRRDKRDFTYDVSKGEPDAYWRKAASQGFTFPTKEKPKPKASEKKTPPQSGPASGPSEPAAPPPTTPPEPPPKPSAQARPQPPRSSAPPEPVAPPEPAAKPASTNLAETLEEQRPASAPSEPVAPQPASDMPQPEQPIVSAASEPVAPQPAAAVRPKASNLRGSQTTAASISDPNKSYAMQWRIMDLSEVLPSHSYRTMEPNPGYPSELQPRDRTRTTSRLQMDRIAKSLRPEMMQMDSQMIDTGAPIIGPDGFVESGNARMMAINRAREAFPEQYEAYKQHLMKPDQLEAKGFKPADIEGIANPVLVRERTTPMDAAERRKFVTEANTSQVLGQTATEGAMTHADAFRPADLLKLQTVPGRQIDQLLLSSEANDLVTNFLKSYNPNEIAALLDPKGNLNKTGLTAIRNSLFANVYGSKPGGERLAQELQENVDEDIRRVGTALMNSLVGMGKTEALVKSGQREADVSMAADVVAAVQKLRALRQANMSVDHYLRSYTAFDEGMTPMRKQLLKFLSDNIRSGKKIADFLDEYSSLVEAMPAKGQMSMMGMPKPPTKAEFIEKRAGDTLQIDQKFTAEGPEEGKMGKSRGMLF